MKIQISPATIHDFPAAGAIMRQVQQLQIQYKQGDLSSMIKITRYDIQPVATPEWAR